MTKTDWTPDSQPSEEADPLSATGMFLSALGKESNQPEKQPEESVAQPAARLETKQAAWPAELAVTPPAPAFSANPASAAMPQDSPGEFTRLFQAAQPARAVPSQTPSVQAPAPSIEPKPAPSSAPGEFTRIFVKSAEARPADRPPAPLARSTPEPSPAPLAAPGSPRMKGFSSGASDSASVEGGFTQIFQSRPSAPAPAPRVQAFTPPTPPPATPAEEIKWPRQHDLGAGESPVDRGASASSATNLFASLAPGGQRQEEIRQQPVEPLPSFTPTLPAAPAAEDSGSVTRLIQRLSEGARTTHQAEAPQPPAIPAEPPSPASDSGPGEFTRMISASQFKAPAPAPPAVPPPASAAAFSMPAAPKFSVPAAPPLTMPPAPKPAPAPAVPAFQAPKIELPPAPIPKPALPALAAPAGKFQEMVPILLVVNTFLLLVLIVLVIFALRAK